MFKITNNFRKIVFTFYLLPFIFIVSCTTSPQSGSLTGTVQLESEEDHSGITIGIYELAELDPDIVAINQEYPHIGVIINQMTEFDHRFGNLIKYSQTDANGNFKIKNIPTGRYNFMAMKDSFGFKYIYEVTINEGDNFIKRQKVKGKRKNYEKKSNSDNFTFSILNFTLDSNGSTRNTSDITLYPEMYINNDINEETTFESSHHYIIENDIFVSGNLTIDQGAVIRLNEGVKLTISGDLTAVGEDENMIWFTSNDSIRFPSSILPSPYKSVELTGSLNKQVSWCKFDHAGTGLLNKVNGFSISDCIFRNSSCGFKSENVDSTFCSNLLCNMITNESEGGIYFYQVDEGCIEKNIINQGYNGMKIKNECNPKIKNNYISNCDYGLDISYYSDPIIKFNEIGNCDFGIYISYNSSSNIEKINFDSEVCIKSYKLYNNSPEIHNNNLKFELYSFQIGWRTYEGLNAEDNYYYTTDDAVIQQSIFDKNDVELSQQQDYGIVNYIPFLIEEVPNAGIE